MEASQKPIIMTLLPQLVTTTSPHKAKPGRKAKPGGTPCQLQYTVVPSPPPNHKLYKKIIRILGIIEVVLGTLSILIAITLIGILSQPYYYPRFDSADSYDPYDTSDSYVSYYYGIRRETTVVGEGIWCGVWILIAGALGISSSKTNSSRCMINAHMAFSIVGAFFSVVLITLSGILAIFNHFVTAAVILSTSLAIIAFISVIILIISASYCCVINGCNCCQPNPDQYVCDPQLPPGNFHQQTVYKGPSSVTSSQNNPTQLHLSLATNNPQPLVQQQTKYQHLQYATNPNYQMQQPQQQDIYANQETPNAPPVNGNVVRP